ncbi:hypothetical protein ACGYLV_14655 [Sulfitobacter sp. M21595]|uniref:hypothetical protein n=1 Tax=Sulfitobacter sp. M21595 TaxID=3368574 RepID=UPI003746B2E6
MKMTGDKKLMRQLKALPENARSHLATAMRRNIEEGEKIANVLAPDVTHETRGNIYSELKDDGLTGIVYAIPSDAPQEDKDRAYSIEHGRKKGNRGTTEGHKYMWQTRQYLQKKFRGRMRRAVKKAVKEVTNG